MEFLHPEAQRIHGHLDDLRIAEVQRVAAPCGVVITAVAHPIILFLSQPAPAEGGTVGSAFSRVVVHHIQDHFDPCHMQQLDHALELILYRCRAGSSGGRAGVLHMRGEEAQCVVAPIVAHA